MSQVLEMDCPKFISHVGKYLLASKFLNDLSILDPNFEILHGTTCDDKGNLILVLKKLPNTLYPHDSYLGNPVIVKLVNSL